MPLKTGHPIFVTQLRPQYTWVANHSRSVCYLCKRRFNMFRHKKNCRVCGEVVCSSCTQKNQSVILDVTGFTKTRVCFACIVACTLPPAGSTIAERHCVEMPQSPGRGALIRTSQSRHRHVPPALMPAPPSQGAMTIRAGDSGALRQSYVHLTPKAWDYEHFGNNFVDATRKTDVRPPAPIRLSDLVGQLEQPKLLEASPEHNDRLVKQARAPYSRGSSKTKTGGVLLLGQDILDSVQKKPLPQPLSLMSPSSAKQSKAVARPYQPKVAHVQHDMQYGYPLDFDWDLPYPKPPTVAFEKQRLDELFNYDILDGKTDDVLDIICDLAVKRLEAPLAAVSFIDHDHQYLKARYGWRLADMPRSQAFCAHVLRTKDVVAVSDTTLDARFDQNPLVTGPYKVRAYLAAPILSPASHLVLGTVFIMDTKPRPFSTRDIETIERLAVAAASHIDSHKYHASASPEKPTTIAVARPEATTSATNSTNSSNSDMAAMLQGLLHKTAMTQQEVACRGSALSHSSCEVCEVE